MTKTATEKIVARWNDVMEYIGCEFITINTTYSELTNRTDYYNVRDGINVSWLLREAEYWLSCYYETGNVRCDDRFMSEYDYKIWVSETGKIKRLISFLGKHDANLIVWKHE